MIQNILLELKKYNIKNLYKITFGFALIPFALTCLFLFIDKDGLDREGMLFYILRYNVGVWSVLGYPFFVVLITQILIDVEKKSNALLYYKAYKKNWLVFINKKILIAFWFVIILTLMNLLMNTLMLFFADYYINDKNSQEMILDSIKKFSCLPIAMLPILYLHSFLVYSLNSYLSFALALLLIIVGIPLANVADFYYVPYTIGGILLEKEPPYLFLFLWSTFVIIISTLGSNLVLKR